MMVGTTIASMIATESIRMVLSAAPMGPCGSRIFIAEPDHEPIATSAPPGRSMAMATTNASQRLSFELPQVSGHWLARFQTGSAIYSNEGPLAVFQESTAVRGRFVRVRL